MRNQIIACVLVLVGIAASAQPALAYDPWYVGPGYGGFGGYGAWGYGGWGGAQTAYSAEATGMSNLVRAQGQYNQATSQAMISQQEARSIAIDNSAKIMKNRQAMKRAAQAEDVKNREADQASRARMTEYQAAHKSPPLSSSEFNSATGKVKWPEPLTQYDFNDQRTALDTMIESGAKSGMSTVLAAQIVLKVGELKDALRGKIQDMPMPVYSECRKFLDRLASTFN